MTKQEFKRFEEVICIDKQNQPIRKGARNVKNLVYKETYTINKYCWFKYGRWWVELVGFPDDCVYSEDSFTTIKTIEEVMEEVLENIEI